MLKLIELMFGVRYKMAMYCTKLSYVVLFINLVLSNIMFIVFYNKLNINKTLLMVTKCLFETILILFHPFLLIMFGGLCT